MLNKTISKNVPFHWEILDDNPYDKDYFQFNLVTYLINKYPSLNSKATSVFGDKLLSYDYFKSNSESIRSWFNDLIKEQQNNIPKIQTTFGLDKTSLDNTLNDFISYLDKKETLELLEGNYYDDSGFGFQCYVPIISFLNKYLSGKEKIIEIGCGTNGLGALSYLQHRGAETIGIDALEINQILLDKIDVKTIKTYWENIDKDFDLESIDVIYTNFYAPISFFSLI
jgi:hypothetical protein